MCEIPVVDFSCLSLEHEQLPEFPNEPVEKLAKELIDAFTTIGFVYIKRHGIKEETIANLFQVGDKFFQLPSEIKSQYEACIENGTEHGWLAPEKEGFYANKPGDFKEAFNVVLPGNDSVPWPVVDGCTFKDTLRTFFHSCEKLTLRMLDVISLGLKLEDKTFLRRMHQKMGSDENKSTLRIIHYPAVNGELKEGQVRCGEHTDYGTITLLFQDNVGGLEVYSQKGGFMPAHPIDGTILINIADMLQRWTNDKLVSTRHRVGLPEKESLHSVARHSTAFFVIPDDDAVIRCLDGSNHYPPINALEYLNQRLADTYI